MSRISYSTKGKSAEVYGQERHYAAWIVGRMHKALSRDEVKFSSFVTGNDSQFCAELNTAILLGNDTIRLMARMHGQCEIHGYIEGQNRAWYADLIDEGRASGLLRESMGWEDVASLCRESDDGPVVTDYSVTESFPSMMAAGWGGWEYDEENPDAWYDLGADKMWELAVRGIRSQERNCEWSPEKWRIPNFGDGKTALDVEPTQ